VSENHRFLTFDGGMSQFVPEVDKVYRDVLIKRDEVTPFSRVWRTGQAVATDELAMFRDYFGHAGPEAFAIKTVFLLPQLLDGRLHSITAFYF